MNNNNPYQGYPYYGYPTGAVPPQGTPQQGTPPQGTSPQGNPPQDPFMQNNASQAQPYKAQNSKTHFFMGIAAGAAVAYLLSNKNFQKGVATTGEKAWSAVRGEVEELKERLEDTQAELQYYRDLHKGDE